MTKTNETVSPKSSTPNIFARGWVRTTEWAKNAWAKVQKTFLAWHHANAPEKNDPTSTKVAKWIFYPLIAIVDLVVSLATAIVSIVYVLVAFAMALPMWGVKAVRTACVWATNKLVNLFSKKSVETQAVTA